MTRRSLRTSVLALATLLPVLLVSVATSQQSDECIDCRNEETEIIRGGSVNASIEFPDIKDVVEVPISFLITIEPQENLTAESECSACIDCQTPAVLFNRVELGFPTTATFVLEEPTGREPVTRTFQTSKVRRGSTPIPAGNEPFGIFTYNMAVGKGTVFGPFRLSLDLSIFNLSSTSATSTISDTRCVCKPGEGRTDPCSNNEPPEISAPTSITIPDTQPSEQVSIQVNDENVRPEGIHVIIDGTLVPTDVTTVRVGQSEIHSVSFNVPGDIRNGEVEIRVSDRCGLSKDLTIPVDILDAPEVTGVVANEGGPGWLPDGRMSGGIER